MVVWLVTQREKDTERFCELLTRLEQRVGGKRTLKDCHRNMSWPERGVYFFFEEGQTRSNLPDDLRVVRVGTHAVTAKSKSRLWHRLYEHKQDGGRSVFRDHVNRALKERIKTVGNQREHNHTRCISNYIGRMPFLWLNVDVDGGHRVRTRLERNAIALLSDWGNGDGDQPRNSWLGGFSARPEIRRSGLWNVQHVKSTYKSSFLEELAQCVDQTGKLVEPPADWDAPMCIVEETR